MKAVLAWVRLKPCVAWLDRLASLATLSQSGCSSCTPLSQDPLSATRTFSPAIGISSEYIIRAAIAQLEVEQLP